MSPDSRNLSRTHREHEKYYSESPLHQAASLQRSSRALTALAEHWSQDAPDPGCGVRRLAGAEGAVDFNASAVRADLATERRSVNYVFSAAELIDQAADLTAKTALLVHDNERPRRAFHNRVEAWLS